MCTSLVIGLRVTVSVRSLDRIIGYTRTDRDDAVRRSKQTLDGTSRLWSQANTAVREAIEY